jgi:hypothetical protein
MPGYESAILFNRPRAAAERDDARSIHFKHDAESAPFGFTELLYAFVANQRGYATSFSLCDEVIKVNYATVKTTSKRLCHACFPGGHESGDDDASLLYTHLSTTDSRSV